MNTITGYGVARGRTGALFPCSLPKEECLSLDLDVACFLWISGSCFDCLLMFGKARTRGVAVCARHSPRSDACKERALVQRPPVRFSAVIYVMP